MPYYIVNTNADEKGRYEVHATTCSWLPLSKNQLDLGYHSDCQSAIRAVQAQNPTLEFDGCAYCSPACHHG